MSKNSRARALAKAATSAKFSAASRASLPDEENLLVFWGTLLASSIIVFAALAAYHNSFSGPFMFDDLSAVTNNPSIRQLGSALSPPANLTVGGRPVLNLTFAVNYALGGMNVGGYHAFNLFIHALAGLTLFGIMRRTLSRPTLRARFGAAAWPLALAVAVIWVVHPLQTEAVTYISQRAESLMGLFYLLTLYGFIRSVESPLSIRWQVFSILACWLGVLSKETIVTVPVIVLLYDRIFVAHSFGEVWRKRWRYYVGLAGMWLLLLAHLRLGLDQHEVGFDQGVTWWSYALTSCRSVVLYLKLAMWPHPLILDYGADYGQHATKILWYVLVLAVFVTGLVIALWRRPVAGFAGAWFFIILAPTSSIVPIAGQPMAEHRMYLSLAGVVAMAVLGLYMWMGRRSLIIFAAMAVGLGWLSLQRNEDYRSNLAIWNDTVAKCPENARAHFNLGNLLLGIPGRLPDAVAEYQAALRIKPDFAEVHSILGMTLATIPGRLPDAILEYEAALRIKPDLVEARFNLGNALLQQGRYSAACEQYEETVNLRPDKVDAHVNLGMALVVMGRLNDAIIQFKAALQIRPGYASAQQNLEIAQNLLQKRRGKYPSESPIH
jgi:Flp pilus assembly protein TadD